TFLSMLTTSESIQQDIEKLTAQQLQQVAEFIAFLRFKEKRQRMELTPELLVSLSTEFAEEDRTLAESGVDDYANMLAKEDAR
ncbi:MAG: hypothetical protein AAGJ95_13015, partial [Cyanobacteria bacterium J06554_11]